VKIKRYTGTNTREVLARIRNDLGPDAVILSNREIVGGVELMAAVDFDASHLQAEPDAAGFEAAPRAPAPQAPRAPAAQRPAAPLQPSAPLRMQPAVPMLHREGAAPIAIPRRAAAAEPVSAPWAGPIDNLRDELQELRQWVRESMHAPRDASDAALAPLAAQLQGLGFSSACARGMAGAATSLPEALRAQLGGIEMERDPLSADGVYALVGATGVGKTTTIAKLAARLVLRHGTGAVALITTDTYRIGGVEQLRIYGRILGVPVAVARDAAELEQQLAELAERRFVLIDTIGLSPRDARLVEQMQWLKGFGARITRLLLLNAGMGPNSYAELWKLYKELPVAACILTKLDETASFGAALQWLREQGLPLWFCTDGQRVPEDLHVASVAKIISLLQGESAPQPMLAAIGKTPVALAASR
jgi:flagellar biosynthesis protein FlhF